MDIFQTKTIILKWINSCETLEQIKFCNEIVDKFIVERFSKDKAIADVSYKLTIVIAEKIKAITK